MVAKLPPRAKPEEIRAIFATLQAAMPEPKTELVYGTPYQLLVAVVLSAQATDVGVNKATAKFYDKVKTPEDMLALGEEKLVGLLSSINFYRNKAKNVMALSHMLVEKHGGEVPQTMDELVALPGVGRKTANVILNSLYGHHTLAVDTHVFRVSRRLGLSRGETPEAVENDLMKIVPTNYLRHAHHWLILHGRYTCVARKPKCAQCPVAAWCHAPEKQVPESL
jgi:endonuclease-3